MRQEIIVNGKPEPLEQATLGQLVAGRTNASARGLAVALNDTLVPRKAWSTTRLRAGDRIEIVKAMVGG
jgi:sulfur carrier protein